MAIKKFYGESITADYMKNEYRLSGYVDLNYIEYQSLQYSHTEQYSQIDDISVNIPSLNNVSIENFKKRTDFLPSDVSQVIIDEANQSVVVILDDGRKGVSTTSGEDEFDPYVGLCISYWKAKNKKVFDLAINDIICPEDF